MTNILDFLIEVGELKGKKRRGWIVHQIKNSETTAEHIFHLAILVWVLGKRKKLNMERAIKMALVHDLCEVYAPDLTPYDPLLPKNIKESMKVLKSWPKFTLAQKKEKEIKKYKQELKGLEKLISKLPPDLKEEMKSLWLDYEKGFTPEGRFVKQADKMINFFQGIEYWKKYGKIQYKPWVRWIKEIIDDPVLLELLQEIEKKEIKKKKK